MLDGRLAVEVLLDDELLLGGDDFQDLHVHSHVNVPMWQDLVSVTLAYNS